MAPIKNSNCHRFKMSKTKQILGAKAETLAFNLLRRRGYKIIARNFRCCFGEIDFIARRGKTIVFIEVRARTSAQFGFPQETIRPKKIKHLLRSAQFYIHNYADPEGEFRFDAVAIVLKNKPKICLIKDII